MKIYNIFLMILIILFSYSNDSVSQDIMKVYVDAGHGGYNTGAFGPSGIPERWINLDVAIMLKNLLASSQIYEYAMVRYSDVPVFNSTRASNANSWGADLYISIHHNWCGITQNGQIVGPNTWYNGTETYYCHSSGTTTRIENSHQFAGYLQGQMLLAYNYNDRGLKDNVVEFGYPLTVLYNTVMPAALTEASFISNAQEESLLYSSTSHKLLQAQALFNGIQMYYTNVFCATPPPPPSGPPATPNNLTITNSGILYANVELDWNSVSGANYYKVYRKVSHSQEWLWIGSPVSSDFIDLDTQIRNETDPEASEFEYAVTAYNSSGESGMSNVESIYGMGFEKKKSENEGNIPNSFGLLQNYPNPFNPITEIRYGLPKASHVTLVIYNVLGQQVAQLVNNDMPAGYHSVKWDASNVASGTYIYKIVAGEFTATKKMVVIK